ncbi:MAG TPA: hypothetical protein VNL77_23935, partial [Roseiflexaceae bacterium]|nr:hypothetical protein [Roseiflexaceae bacterium]
MFLLALLALAVLAPLLYLPGALVARALRGAPPPDPLERIYQHTALGALIAGWLAFTLGQLGIFSAWLYLLLLAAVCAAAALVHKTRTRYAHTAQGTGWVSGRTAPSLTLPFLLTLGIAFLLVARPFEVVIGVRDAGVYANAGFAMARTGALVQRDALVAQIAADQRSADAALAASAAQAETNFLGVQPRQRNIATRLRAAGFYINHGDLEEGRVTPQGLHLFTAWVGLLTALLGLQGGLLAPALMGLLGVWSVGMLARRLGGPWAGLLAALFLALNAAQVWFSRYSTTETTAQFLTFAGLYFFAALTNDQRPTTNDETPVGGVDGGRSSFVVRHKEFAALLSGLAFGQLALARIDFFLVLAPLALYLLYVAVARRWSRAHTWLAAGLSALLAHAATQFTGLARAYFFDTLFAR